MKGCNRSTGDGRGAPGTAQRSDRLDHARDSSGWPASQRISRKEPRLWTPCSDMARAATWYAEQTFRGRIRRNDAQAQLVLVHENAAATLFPEQLRLARRLRFS
jgi:hypothetical protein